MRITSDLEVVWYENADGEKRFLDWDKDLAVQNDAFVKEGFRYQVTQFANMVRTEHLKIMPDDGSELLFISNHQWSDSLITAMVLSGDFTASGAIKVDVTACVRCLNALAYRYEGPEHGYPEDSKEYQESRHRCMFCREDEEDERAEQRGVGNSNRDSITDSR